jgi:hypothetical protein
MNLHSIIPTLWLILGFLGAASGLILAMSRVKIPVLDGEFDLGSVMLFASIVMVLLGVVFLPGEGS